MVLRPPISTFFPYTTLFRSFRNLLAPWLTRLERFVSPRATALLDHRAANAFTGLLLVLLGILLSLPIPFTNFLDRKSTRLNSSHSQISYAVFCLKKKRRIAF